jgi:hypothetical protein
VIAAPSFFVRAGLGPAIHEFGANGQHVDARHKAGHNDENMLSISSP